MNVLVTGGTGFIGSHTCVELLNSGHDVVIVDNLSNSQGDVVDHIASITGRHPTFIKCDIRNQKDIEHILVSQEINAVIHFAALKAVGESWHRPLDYFDNNVSGTIAILRAMETSGVRHFVFSSSATVYGEPDQCPILESAPTRTTNPYGRTKLICEQLLMDRASANPPFHAAVLRYFNPVGAHPTGLIGEAPNGTPNNLMPYVAQVAIGQREYLQVFGNDYETSDGTGIRDYIHVVDLAIAHVRALDFVISNNSNITVNLGTGKGYSVLEVVAAFERASGQKVPTRIVDRRHGDVATCFADAKLAQELLGWRAERNLDQMCIDAWRWQLHSNAGSD